MVRAFPVKVEQQPERYALPPNASPADVRRALERLLDDESQRRRFTYVKSDRGQQEITLKAELE